MARGEILMKAGVVEVVKSIMLSTRNQNGREVGRVASKNTQRERNGEGKTGHSSSPPRGQARGVLFARVVHKTSMLRNDG